MNINDKNSKTYSAPEYQPLIPLPEFRRSGRAPVDMHHLILFNKVSLEKEGHEYKGWWMGGLEQTLV